MRAAVYLRVSTRSQDLANQEADIKRIIEARALELDGRHVYREVESTKRQRPIHREMMEAARRGEFRVLIFWSLDRFGRSMWESSRDIKELDRIGIQIISVQESWFDTTGPVRDLLLAIFSWVAEQERRRIGERTRAGMEAARRRGKDIGRPSKGYRVAPADVLALRAAGRSWPAISRELGCTVGVARLICKRAALGTEAN